MNELFSVLLLLLGFVSGSIISHLWIDNQIQRRKSILLKKWGKEKEDYIFCDNCLKELDNLIKLIGNQ